MKLPIVKRGSRENPVSVKEISALYQSCGSAVSTPTWPMPPRHGPSPALLGQPCSLVPRDKRAVCYGEAAKAPSPPQKKGSGVLHRVLWSLGPRAHPEHRSSHTQRWAGSEPLAPSQHFLFGKRRGSQPAACFPKHASSSRARGHTDMGSIKKFPLGCKISPSRAAARGRRSSPDLLPLKECKAGKKPPQTHKKPQTHTQKVPSLSKRGCLDFLCPICKEI